MNRRQRSEAQKHDRGGVACRPLRAAFVEACGV